MAKEIAKALGGKFQVLVHRDRDSLTDGEAAILIKHYTDNDVDLWLPNPGDVEGYFCQPSFISELTGCTLIEAEGYIAEIHRKQKTAIEAQFISQRKSHNEEIYTKGGSPKNEEVWDECQARPLRGAKGKFVFNQLKNEIGQKRFSEGILSSHVIASELATDLRQKLEAAIARA